MKFFESSKRADTNGSDLFNLRIRHYGPANSDKIIYNITEDSSELGFFAMYRGWLEYLYFAEVCGYVPVIKTGPNFTYQEKEKINGTNNPFEYYFIQPSLISVRSANVSRNVINAVISHREMVELVLTGKYANYKTTKRYIKEMSHVVKKYIRFNQATWGYISESTKRLNIENEKILGIHIRGTDFRAKYDNHPIYVNELECFKEIDDLFEKKEYAKIFIATDDERILKNFVDRYGEKICFYDDVQRSSKNQSVAFSRSSRKNHKYLLGLEVIRDMYTLSMCSGLIAGISQVAICARINKMARGEQYQDISIIDKGLNKNGRIFKRY